MASRTHATMRDKQRETVPIVTVFAPPERLSGAANEESALLSEEHQRIGCKTRCQTTRWIPQEKVVHRLHELVDIRGHRRKLAQVAFVPEPS